ncbi:glycoside hydrolase family 6 protein [Geodermatophilus sp. URMC 65]
MTFHGPNTGAAQAAAQPGRSAADAAALAELAGVPTSLWLGAWSGDVTATVRREVAAAQAVGAVPVLVTYNVPDRDCSGYSAGGVGSSAEYLRWVQAVAAGIGHADVVVVVEPDALAQLCGDPAERLAVLRSAVDLLEANPGTRTHLDAGNATSVGAPTMAERLRAVGVTAADGFVLNVSNFETTADNVAYGQQVSALLGGAHFVVDTSRNGNGPGTDWCNPAGRALGERPTAQTGQPRVDAYLWVKRPGESDGTCNGGPRPGPSGTPTRSGWCAGHSPRAAVRSSLAELAAMLPRLSAHDHLGALPRRGPLLARRARCDAPAAVSARRAAGRSRSPWAARPPPTPPCPRPR